VKPDSDKTEIVTYEATVQFIIRDEEAVSRCFTEEWRTSLYNLPDRDAVLRHWAWNALANGIKDVHYLDGWADLAPGTVTMTVLDVVS
jgi:hypothetical protein